MIETLKTECDENLQKGDRTISTNRWANETCSVDSPIKRILATLIVSSFCAGEHASRAVVRCVRIWVPPAIRNL